MKKIIRGFMLLAVVAILASSCKSHERCPAYGSTAKTHSHTGKG